MIQSNSKKYVDAIWLQSTQENTLIDTCPYIFVCIYTRTNIDINLHIHTTMYLHTYIVQIIGGFLHEIACY